MKVADYILALPKQRVARFKAILTLIKKLSPEAVLSMKYKMPTFENNQYWLSIASQKHYLSVYACSAQHLDSFKEKYPKIKTGKGCINIKDTDSFELDDLTSVSISALTPSKK